MASGALQAVRDAGLHVPKDVSLIGSGDLELARLVDPPLTTLGYDVPAIAAEGTRMLVERLERGGPMEIFQKKFPAQLIPRQSTARPS
jgi:LacI family transcriptional regulator